MFVLCLLFCFIQSSLYRFHQREQAKTVIGGKDNAFDGSISTSSSAITEHNDDSGAHLNTLCTTKSKIKRQWGKYRAFHVYNHGSPLRSFLDSSWNYNNIVVGLKNGSVVTNTVLAYNIDELCGAAL